MHAKNPLTGSSICVMIETCTGSWSWGAWMPGRATKQSWQYNALDFPLQCNGANVAAAGHECNLFSSRSKSVSRHEGLSSTLSYYQAPTTGGSSDVAQQHLHYAELLPLLSAGLGIFHPRLAEPAAAAHSHSMHLQHA